MTLEEIIGVVEDANLFKGMRKVCVQLNMKQVNYKVEKYKKGEIIAHEGDRCDCVGIVLEGQLELRKEFLAGDYMTLTYLNKSDVFGEVIIFSKMSSYPATIFVKSDCQILYLCREEILDLMEGCETILQNFMGVLSNKIVMLNRKTAILSLKSIEEKVASYLLREYKVKGKEIFNIPLKRKELAGYLNVPRPSLSRTMGKMKEDGVIDFYQNTIKILDRKALEKYLFK